MVLAITSHQEKTNQNHDERPRVMVAVLKKIRGNKYWGGCGGKGTLVLC